MPSVGPTVDPDNLYCVDRRVGRQTSQLDYDPETFTSRTYYGCLYGREICKIGVDLPCGAVPNYDMGDAIGVLYNDEGKPSRLYYIFDEELLEEDTITLGNSITFSYSIPIQDSYRLGIAPANTTLSIPEGEYALTEDGRAIYFSVAVDALLRDTNMVIFE